MFPPVNTKNVDYDRIITFEHLKKENIFIKSFKIENATDE
jgi:hypothetical protein